MRFVNRGDVAAPPSLSVPNGAGAEELTKARQYYAAAVPPSKAYKFVAYKGDDVAYALRSLFFGKCAYCESAFEAVHPADVEHYRPKGEVEDAPEHPGYWWLAMRWDNLLPSCIDCNRRRRQTTAVNGMSLNDLEQAFLSGQTLSSGKKDAFPTLDQVWADPEADPNQIEQPLLIDPTRINPADHIRWPVNEELSLAVPLGEVPSRIGEASIHVYGLNRIGLTEARTKVLRELKARAERIKEILDLAADPNLPEPTKQNLINAAQRHVRDIEALAEPRQPYSCLVAEFVRDLHTQLVAEAVA